MNFNEWLEQRGLGKYAGIFAENEIDEIDILAHLSEKELESLGIPLGARKKVLRALSEEGAQIQPPATSEPPADTQPSAASHPGESPAETAAPESSAQPEFPSTVPAQPAPETPPETMAAVEPTSGPHAPSPSTLTRIEAKGKSSRKATAIFIAVAVHVVIILIATTLTIFAASKDEPEIIAMIAPPSTSPQQEMKKKTVQKQVKQAPSAASAAAAPMAQMMKANAEARFSTPDVTRTSTGPLGVGEGDLGTGAFGAGDGLGEAGDGGSFFGVSTSGNLAVVFDITRSMYSAVPKVIEEIDRNFKTAQVMVVFSGGFEQRPLTSIIPYKSNDKVQLLVEINAKTAKTGAKQSIAQAKNMNRALFKLQRCDSIQSNHMLTRSSTNLGPGFQSLGTALELMINQSSRPGTIFVFSDFSDSCNVGYMKKIEAECRAKKVKVVFWSPFASPSANFKKVLSDYKRFAKAVGGEVKVELLK
ncbi:MAG: hypothetical protein P1U86_08010 [Verrucomicrobiales bacterium]|nr:hypothetical protein [Verrucomicrobiales bacterium]